MPPGTARGARGPWPDTSRGTRASAGRTRRRSVRPLPSQPPGVAPAVWAHGIRTARPIAPPTWNGICGRPWRWTAHPRLDEIELGDPRFFLRPDVDAAFARLRAESPIHRTRDLGEPRGPDFWSVTRYDDVRAVSRDFPPSTTHRTWSIEDYQRSGNSILHLDPPEHTRLRLIVNKGFTPRMVEQMADDVREPDARIPARRPTRRRRVRPRRRVRGPPPAPGDRALLGVPPTDEQWLIDSLVQTFGVSDPANNLPISERVRVMEELGAYAHELGRLRLDDPRDDLTTVLVNAEVEDDDGGRHRLQPGDYARFFSTLAAAGSETSRNGIAHGVLAPRPASRPAGRAAGRPRRRVPDRGGGDRPVLESGHAHAAQRRPRHRARRPTADRGRPGRDLVPLGQPRRERVRTAGALRRHPAPRTTTSGTAPVVRTSASAPTSPAWRSTSHWRSCTDGSPISPSPGSPSASRCVRSTASSTCRCRPRRT